MVPILFPVSLLIFLGQCLSSIQLMTDFKHLASHSQRSLPWPLTNFSDSSSKQITANVHIDVGANCYWCLISWFHMNLSKLRLPLLPATCPYEWYGHFISELSYFACLLFPLQKDILARSWILSFFSTLILSCTGSNEGKELTMYFPHDYQ